MILSTIVGDQNTDIKNEWTVESDKYKNTFITNSTIRQRIRLGKHVSNKLKKVYSNAYSTGYKLDNEDVEEVVGEVSGYNCQNNIIFSNSNKNMNLSIIKFWSKDAEEVKNHKDTNILYVTLINKNYKLLTYALYGDQPQIIQTYRRSIVSDDSSSVAYQGCAIEFPSIESDTPVDILVMTAKDFKLNRYVKITISVDKDYHVLINKSIIEDKKERQKLGAINGKMKKGMVQFYITCPSGYLPTSTFIVNGTNEDLVNDVAELAEKVNGTVLSLPAGQDSFTDKMNEEEKTAIYDMFDKAFDNGRIRAVTTVGVRLPFEFSRKYKLLYIFDLNPDTGVITCVRSN